ncbi:MAG: hypothetical protein AAFV95_20395 [Bacteroidota bacterium]
MHDIEPYPRWRDYYVAEEDERSPFYGREYSEFHFTQKIYNYFIHPQWDAFGSPTLYMKLLYVGYEEKFAIIELMGEWNDCLQNDIMFLKREIVDHLAQYDISRYIIACDNVLNFHGSDDCYYEEWSEDVSEYSGWICLLNTLDHVRQEMEETFLQQYVNFGGEFNDLEWRALKPKVLFKAVDRMIHTGVKQLYY